MEDRIYWLWLVMAFQPGNPRIWQILEDAGEDPETAYHMIASGKYQELTDKEKVRAVRTHLDQAKGVAALCGDKGIRLVCFSDEEYPQRLREIYNPPALLFCMGSLAGLDEELAVTVVGTRTPSNYSVAAATNICDELARVGVTLVSGFAVGIDSMAHRSALFLRGRTIAVLGAGIDVDYPKPNAPLKPVIARRGAVVTEFLPGTCPYRANFPLRNRILSGLSLGTLVVEAGETSGSLITAELALQQGRDVFAVPPLDIFDKRYGGQVRLLREGAAPVFSHLDVLYAYYENFAHTLRPLNARNWNPQAPEKMDCLLFDGPEEPALEAQDPQKPLKRRSGNRTGGKADVEKEKQTADSGTRTDSESGKLSALTEGLEGELKEVALLLAENGPMLADEIGELLSMPPAAVLTHLTELEMLDAVHPLGGQRYELSLGNRAGEGEP